MKKGSVCRRNRIEPKRAFGQFENCPKALFVLTAEFPRLLTVLVLFSVSHFFWRHTEGLAEQSVKIGNIVESRFQGDREYFFIGFANQVNGRGHPRVVEVFRQRDPDVLSEQFSELRSRKSATRGNILLGHFLRIHIIVPNEQKRRFQFFG